MTVTMINPLESAASPPLHPRPGLTIAPAEITHAPALQTMVRAAYTKYIDRIGKPPAPMNTDYSGLILSEKQSVFILRDEQVVGQQPKAAGGDDGDDEDQQSDIVGSIVLGLEPMTAAGTEEDGDGDGEAVAVVKINNVVVAPGHQGKGYGRVLMEFAEGAAKGLVGKEERGGGAGGRHVRFEKAELSLFTNVMMWENLVVYPKMGFVEVERRTEDGYERVFYRKPLLP